MSTVMKLGMHIYSNASYIVFYMAVAKRCLLEGFKIQAPPSRVTYVCEIYRLLGTCPDAQKKPLGAIPYLAQEVHHLDFKSVLLPARTPRILANKTGFIATAPNSLTIIFGCWRSKVVKSFSAGHSCSLWHRDQF